MEAPLDYQYGGDISDTLLDMEDSQQLDKEYQEMDKKWEDNYSKWVHVWWVHYYIVMYKCKGGSRISRGGFFLDPPLSLPQD